MKVTHRLDDPPPSEWVDGFLVSVSLIFWCLLSIFLAAGMIYAVAPSELGARLLAGSGIFSSSGVSILLTQFHYLLRQKKFYVLFKSRWMCLLICT